MGKKKVWTREMALAYLATHITIDDTTGCHEWQGPITSDSYGQIGPGGLYRLLGIKGAHRLSFALFHNHVFEGRHEHVMHQCDNRRCINPTHLALGTATENMAHAAERGAMPRGEDHPRAKLTEDDVMTIKRLIEEGWRNCYIKQKFDQIGTGAISKIRTGKAWTHLPA